jgi:hypothetical protein
MKNTYKVYCRISYESQSKQLLFLEKALTDSFLNGDRNIIFKYYFDKVYFQWLNLPYFDLMC